LTSIKKTSNLKIKRLIIFFLVLLQISGFGQSIDDSFSQKKMKKDLAVFKEIRQKVNSGLYKYRTKEQIDSTYNWAEEKINSLSTYRDFFNLIAKLTDYEGSLHNETNMPHKRWQKVRKEENGYFPLPVKCIQDKWIINYADGPIPLGTELVEINDTPIAELVAKLDMYYTTDGNNLSGKKLGVSTHFARYYRLAFGLQDSFRIRLKRKGQKASEEVVLKSVSYAKYYERFNQRHSRPFDQINYAKLDDDQKYSFKRIDSVSGLLSIHSFGMGNESTKEHKAYAKFLDSIFTSIQSNQLKNLIVDVRYNGGGDDPNDLITYSYLSQREFQENKQAWIAFKKIPLIRYYNINIPKFIRPLVVGKYNRKLQEIFPLEKNGKYFQDSNSKDHTIRYPSDKAFNGKVYLLIGPAVASAGSLFAAMLAGNENTTVIGEESAGGYYGHNGHTSMEYKLPESKLVTQFSIVNLTQDVAERPNQIDARGIIPDIEVEQSYQDFLSNKDTQLNFTLDLIRKE